MYEFAVNFVNILVWFGTTRVSISKIVYKDGSVDYKSKYITRFPLYLYIAFHLNSSLRILGLIALNLRLCGIKLDFLSSVTAIVFTACIVYILSGLYFFFYTSPLMEAICEFWNVQRIIFRDIPSDGKVADFLQFRIKAFVWLITILCGFIANVSFNLQLVADIKEPLLSYNLLHHSGKRGFLGLILHVHNALFIAHVWAIYSLATFLWTILARGLVQTLAILQENIEQETDTSTVLQITLMHYRKLVLLAREFDRSLAYPMMWFIGTVFAQMIYNLYMVFQLIKREAADGRLMAIVFYVQDATLCPVILFFMYKVLGLVEDAAKNLMESIRFKTRELESNERKYFEKVIQYHPIIEIRNGPSRIGKYSVAKGIFNVSNYYICAILW